MCVYLYIVIKNKHIMTIFTKENQKENNISTTTSQTLNHSFYSNIEITISGRCNTEEECTVWVNTGGRMTQRFSNINLDEAIIEANKLITGDVF